MTSTGGNFAEWGGEKTKKDKVKKKKKNAKRENSRKRYGYYGMTQTKKQLYSVRMKQCNVSSRDNNL